MTCSTWFSWHLRSIFKILVLNLKVTLPRQTLIQTFSCLLSCEASYPIYATFLFLPCTNSALVTSGWIISRTPTVACLYPQAVACLYPQAVACLYPQAVACLYPQANRAQLYQLTQAAVAVKHAAMWARKDCLQFLVILNLIQPPLFSFKRKRMADWHFLFMSTRCYGNGKFGQGKEMRGKSSNVLLSKRRRG